MLSIVAVLAAVAVGLLVVDETYVFEGGFNATDVAVPPAVAVSGLLHNRAEATFPCGDDGERCRARLYVPESARGKPVPVVIMGHGFAATVDFGLEQFAQHFASKAGIAAFVFDYRHWGGSDGTPRHVIEVAKQHADWFSALDYVFDGLNDDFDDVIDPGRMGIWGSSFAGGHVVSVAANYPKSHRIKAVVSQVPYTDGVQSLPALALSLGPVWALKVTGHALKDMARNLLGLPRHHISILDERLNPDSDVASPGAAILATPECADYWDLIPPPGQRLGGWQNKVAATIGLAFPMYRPVADAPKISARIPVLGVIAVKDSLCPVAGVQHMFEIIPGEVETRKLEGGHFDAYLSAFPQVVAWEAEFLAKHLQATP